MNKCRRGEREGLLAQTCCAVGGFGRRAQSCRLCFSPVVPVKSGLKRLDGVRPSVCTAVCRQQPGPGWLPLHGACPQASPGGREVSPPPSMATEEEAACG